MLQTGLLLEGQCLYTLPVISRWTDGDFPRLVKICHAESPSGVLRCVVVMPFASFCVRRRVRNMNRYSLR